MSSAKDGYPNLELSVESVNAARSQTSLTVRRRARRDLRPVEAALMARYRPEMSGNVLEIGSRGDVLTEVLCHHATAFTGIARSPREAELCRKRHPSGTFLHRDVINLDGFDDGEFQAVIAGRFAFDHLADEQRRHLLAQISRVLDDGGAFIFSSHNLACESLVRPPLRATLLRPWRIARIAAAVRNRSLLRGLQQRAYGYALLNDETEIYSRLSYYVSRDTQESQLRDSDLHMIECVDQNDEIVSAEDHAYGERELFFVARPGAEITAPRLVDREVI